MTQSNAGRMLCCSIAVMFLGCAFGGCGFTQRRISKVSLSFMSKDPDLLAFREKEARALVEYGVFFRDMTPDGVKLILGSPTFVWRAKAEGTPDTDGYDLKYGYQLDRATSLRADFDSGRLRRLRWQVDESNMPGGVFTDIELRVRKR